MLCILSLWRVHSFFQSHDWHRDLEGKTSKDLLFYEIQMSALLKFTFTKYRNAPTLPSARASAELPLWIGQLCWKAFAGREVEQMCWCVKTAERPCWMWLCQASLRGHARPLSEPAQSPLISDPINKMYSDSIKQPSCCAGGQKPLGENHGKHSFNCPSTFLKNIKLH